VALLADRISLGEPLRHLGVDLGWRPQAEEVHHVSRGVGVDSSEARALEPASQDDVAVEPAPSGHQRREAHPDLERDPRLLGQHQDRPQLLDKLEDAVEGLAHRAILALEVTVEVTGGPAGVGLVPVRERTPTGRTGPERHGATVSAADRGDPKGQCHPLADAAELVGGNP